MIKSIRNSRLKAVPIVFSAALLMMISPLSVHAENTDVNVPSFGSSGQDVTATFTIDNDTLIDLGYGAIVSVPVTVPLSYKSLTKTFEGDREVYCSGIINDGKKVTVNVDTVSTDLGKIVDSSNNEYYVDGKEGFAVNLSRTEWSQSEMASNLTKVNNGNLDNLIKSTLSVTIPGRGFVPRVTGAFESKVPLLIRQENAD